MQKKNHVTELVTYMLRRSLMKAIGQMLLESEFEHQFHKSNYLLPKTMPFGLVKKKLRGHPLRAFFMSKIYDYVNIERPTSLPHDGAQFDSPEDKKQKEDLFQKHIFFTRQLPLIVEGIITIQYYSNQIFDSKGDVVNNKASIDDNIKFMENLMPTLYHYIWANETPKEMRCRAMMTVMEILRLGAVGQVVEDECNIYEIWLSNNVPNPLSNEVEKFFDQEILDFLMSTVLRRVDFPPKKLPFLKMYFKKIYLRNAALYGLMTELILDYSQAEDKERISLKKFAVLFAIMHQLVNDIGDLVPSNRGLSTMEKTNKDAFSDLRNNTLTLPTMLHLLADPDGLMANILKNKITRLDNNEEENLLIDATRGHSVFVAMSIGKDIQKKAVSYLDPTNEHFRLLADMCRIAENNKYYRHFYDREQDYKSYRKRPRKLHLHQSHFPKNEGILSDSLAAVEDECV